MFVWMMSPRDGDPMRWTTATRCAAPAVALLAGTCSAQTLHILTAAAVYGISDNGARAAGSRGRSAFWSAPDGWTVFGDDAGFPTYNIAQALSGDGQTAAGIESGESGPGVAHRWSGAGTHQTLGRLAGYSVIQVSDVDRTGSVIVGHSEGNLGQAAQAWVWTESRGLRGLGQTRPGGRGTARGVSGDGRVVVGVGGAGIVADAFVWTEADGMRILPPAPGSRDGEANDAKADGSVIVGSSGVEQTACVWRNGAIQLLDAPPDYLRSRATSVSDDGSVILGLAEAGPGGMRAFVWVGGAGPRPLSQYLADFGITLPEGTEMWGHDETLKVSGDGRTFIGELSGNGGYFVATIPTPQTALPLLGLLTLRRRCRARPS
jgi:uncharacterized membrane protein